jgi:hypothetical protein
MTQYTTNYFHSLPKTMQLFLCCFMVSLNTAYAAVTQLSENDIGFAKVSGKVGTVEKTAGCLIVFSPQHAAKEVFCRYELGKSRQFYVDDDKGRITVIGTNTAGISDAVLPKANNQKDFAKRITAFLKTGYQLPLDVNAIATFMSNPQFPNGNLADKKPTKIYILERDYLAENTDDKTFAFLVHNLIQRRETLVRTETEIDALKNTHEAFTALTNLEVRKLLTLELDSIASQDNRLNILKKEDVKAILLDKNAQHLLKNDNVINVLGNPSVPTVLANPAVQSILNNEDAIAKLSDKNIVAFLNQEGVPELLNNPTFQDWLQTSQNDLENQPWLLKWAIFVGSQLEVVAILIVALVILFFQWRLSRKTRQSLSNLETGKHGNQKIIQSLATVENQINADSEMRQALGRIEDMLEKKSGIKAVKAFIQVLSRCGLPELKNIELAKLPEWAQTQFDSQTLVVLPPSNSSLTVTALRDKQEIVKNLLKDSAGEKAPVEKTVEKHPTAENKVGPVEKTIEHPAGDKKLGPVEKTVEKADETRAIEKTLEILNELDVLVHKDFQSEAEMWKYLLDTAAEKKWLDHLLAVLQYAFSMKEELEKTQREREQLQTVLSQRFHLSQPQDKAFSDWIEALLNQQGTWIWLQPKSIEGFLSNRRSVVNQIKENISLVCEDMQNLPDVSEQPLLRLEEEVSKDWNHLLNKQFQSVDDMNQQLATLTDKWLNTLLMFFKQYLSTKVERDQLQQQFLDRFIVSKPEDKKASIWIDELLQQPGRLVLLQPHFINALLSSQTDAIHQMSKQMARGSQDNPVLSLLRVNEISAGWKNFLRMSFQSNEDMWAYLHKASEGWLGTLVSVLEQYQSLKAEQNRMQAVLSERFSPSQAEPIDFSLEGFRTQKGIWRWLQLSVIAEMLACQHCVAQLKTAKESFADRQNLLNNNNVVTLEDILGLLCMDEVMTGCQALVSQQFPSNEKMRTQLLKTDGGSWIHRLFRANDLLQAYFAEQPQFRLLSRHLANATGALEVMFIEKGIRVLKPILLEPVPPKSKIFVTESSPPLGANPVLRALDFVQRPVSERLNPNSPNHCPEFVVDIQTYGLIDSSTKKPLSKIQVVLSNPSEWELTN